ncbi:O-methylsterigmatocystin oxidoreductase [Ceratobasidium theobromae]|uniref:O-methylsterigmatocystin oxidoreductase n=1 Tax=Ceratobasidium theobromae TaxID=1582974 RepID=A0A5N5QC29_9AGAM|nr:O-methylsterigmatocystin oxidoreductase [Ceratobasidium theobromae]
MASAIYLEAFVAGLLVTLIFTIYVRPRRDKVPCPPSLKSEFLIGHARVIPLEREWEVFAQWSKELDSDIVHAEAFGRHIIVLNSIETAIDLLEKRSSNYSDRPELTMISDENLMGWGQNTVTRRYDDGWRRARRIIHQRFSKTAVEELWPIQEQEAQEFLQKLLADDSRFMRTFREAAASSVMLATYGYKPLPKDDPFVTRSEVMVEALARAGLPTNYLVNVFPILRHVPSWFPLTGFKRECVKWRVLRDQVVDEPMEWVEAQVSEGTAIPSFVSMLLQQYGKNPVEYETIKWAAGTMFAAGSDTTISAMATFFLAMELFPEVQLKAQEELDAVIGCDRLPTMQDMKDLPYVRCIMKEVLRWIPPVPLGIPHAAVEEDIYRGYRIPAGSIVMGNVWAITRDPAVYPNPEKFNPDRFLDGTVPDAPVFGFGRRACPGQYFAESSLLLAISHVLLTIHIGMARDASGRDIVPSIETTGDSLLCIPKEFGIKLTPRSKAALDLINA